MAASCTCPSMPPAAFIGCGFDFTAHHSAKSEFLDWLSTHTSPQPKAIRSAFRNFRDMEEILFAAIMV
jgi:hypothetical protein